MVSRRNSPSPNHAEAEQNEAKHLNRRKSIKTFFKKSLFSTKVNEENQKQENVNQTSSFVQIYKTAKYRLSRRLVSKSSSSSQVNYDENNS